jgi:D-alanyl-lipoteichoic acid acyltransferase DltB (MBOAT superfamily)
MRSNRLRTALAFNSLPFIFLFLPLVMAGWRLVRPRRAALVFMIAASYAFYAFAAGWYALLMLVSTTVDFTVGLWLDRETRPGRRKGVLLLSLAFNLGLLSFFKYSTFFRDTVNDLAGHPVMSAAFHVVLPAGISFYTFQSMGYSIDVYRRDLAPSRSFIEFAAFVSLFPQLIAGPIVRPKVLLPQLAAKDPVDNSRVTNGLMLFTCGLLKKVMVADRLAFYADPILNAPKRYGSVDLWLSMVAFSLQIYFDFSGYTDMARGLARMLGLELTRNFDSPYHADSPSDFWKRWHISLSTWLRDYLYIPLGGNRKGKRRTDVNLMITMLLGGLWHGAGWNFIIWGGFHGLLLLMFHRIERPWQRLHRAVRHGVMLPLILLSWIPFRMHTLADLGTFLRRATFRPDVPTASPTLWAYCALGVLLCALPKNSNDIRWNLGWRETVGFAALAVVAILHLNLSSKFIYFAF